MYIEFIEKLVYDTLSTASLRYSPHWRTCERKSITMENYMEQSAYHELSGIVLKGRLLRDELMSRHTTFRVGGPADVFVMPGT